MNAKTKVGLEILEAALLLGLLGDALLRATPWGLNVLLWVGALVGAMTMLVLRRQCAFWNRETIALHASLIVFAGFFVWRDSITLQTFDALIILTILTVLGLPALGIQARLAGFLHYLFGAISSGLNAALAPVQLILSDIEWKTIPRNGWTKHLSAVLKGLAIAAPIILVFGALFMAADAIFEGFVENTFKINPGVLLSHFFLFGFLAWICAGYLRGALFGSLLNQNWETASQTPIDLNKTVQSVVDDSVEDGKLIKNKVYRQTENKTKFIVPAFLQLGAIEIGVVLGAINLLFLSFVIVQFRYFFGGMNLVQTTTDLKLADYARRGFFELCWVAALVLPILLTTHLLLKKDNPVAEKLFRILATIKIGLLFIIMYSAVERMMLYTGALGYGMTEMRFYPTAFIFWLALVFAWFALTVLRGQAQHFAWGALWMALFVVAGLHILNPDDFIVRHNVQLRLDRRNFDAWYLSGLSADATPSLVRALPELSFHDQCIVKNRVSENLNKNETQDWRTFNFSRWHARQNLLDYKGGFDTAGCPDETKRIFDRY